MKYIVNYKKQKVIYKTYIGTDGTHIGTHHINMYIYIYISEFIGKHTHIYIYIYIRNDKGIYNKFLHVSWT